MAIPPLLNIEELGDDLCNYCPMTDCGSYSVNTSHFNLCEGRSCEEAYECYEEEFLEEQEELKVEEVKGYIPVTLSFSSGSIVES